MAESIGYRLKPVLLRLDAYVVAYYALQSFSRERASKVFLASSMMYLLILDSLGNTELLLILVAALIFFGPRRLPQLGRQLGRSLAEFRRASEDFKRTWEREVNLDNFEKGLEPETSFLSNASEKIRAAREAAARELNPFEPEKPAAPPITPVEADLVEPRNPTAHADATANTDQPKHEWL